ncbi:Major facilitator superfamily MFS-1 [mine drainage metagenome]|uniref:Major facilitator superfamily MFS-1 n=3 Tax=mine drainage metagenome TaxID=410659 RepID=T1AAC4_9ZZZZ
MVSIFLLIDQGVAVTMGLWAINAFGMALSGPAQSAMIADVTRALDLPMAYSIQRVFVNAGFAISPALGGLIADSLGLSYLFLFGGIATLGEGLVLLLFLRETLPGGRGSTAERHWAQFSAPFRDRTFLLMLSVLAGGVVVANQFGTPLTLYLVDVRQLPLSEFGYIYAINGALVVLMQIPISRWIERTRHYLVWLAGGTLLYGIGFVLFGLGAAFPIFAAAMIILTLGENSTSPIQQTVVSNFAGPQRRGSYFGTYNATANAARAVGPVLGTLLLALGSTVWWASIFASALFVALLVLFLRDRLGSRVERGTPGAPKAAGA